VRRGWRRLVWCSCYAAETARRRLCSVFSRPGSAKLTTQQPSTWANNPSSPLLPLPAAVGFVDLTTRHSKSNVHSMETRTCPIFSLPPAYAFMHSFRESNAASHDGAIGSEYPSPGTEPAMFLGICYGKIENSESVIRFEDSRAGSRAPPLLSSWSWSVVVGLYPWFLRAPTGNHVG